MADGDPQPQDREHDQSMDSGVKTVESSSRKRSSPDDDSEPRDQLRSDTVKRVCFEDLSETSYKKGGQDSEKPDLICNDIIGANSNKESTQINWHMQSSLISPEDSEVQVEMPAMS